MNEDVRWLPHPACIKPHGLWSAPDKEATEVEVTAFIAALVTLTKPSVVVETGTYRAHTSAAIAAALEANGTGKLLTFELDQERALAAHDALREHVDAGRVAIYASAFRRFTRRVDLAFLDSGMRARGEEMNLVWPLLNPGGIVAVHDASPLRPPGQVRPPGRHSMLEFATPRGLNLFQKPW